MLRATALQVTQVLFTDLDSFKWIQIEALLFKVYEGSGSQSRWDPYLTEASTPSLPKRLLACSLVGQPRVMCWSILEQLMPTFDHSGKDDSFLLRTLGDGFGVVLKEGMRSSSRGPFIGLDPPRGRSNSDRDGRTGTRSHVRHCESDRYEAASNLASQITDIGSPCLHAARSVVDEALSF